jgi:hypothetical protein
LGGEYRDFLVDILTVAGGASDLTDLAGVQNKFLKWLAAVGTDEFENRHVSLRK